MAAPGDDESLSKFQKTVCLDEWWLIRAETEIEGKRLAVAGFTSPDDQAVQAFSSAPVLKRYDVFTLETTDGICVMIKGFMNKARALENGFPSEVFSHFLFGFPPHWEACAEKCLGQGFASEDVINVDASTIDYSVVTKENYEEVITEKTFSLSPCVAAPKLDQNLGDIMIQEVSKKSNKAVRFSRRLGGAENKDCKKIAGSEKESTLKEASTTVKKTKGNPVTPRGEDLVSVVSPDSFSCKRSRSGRLLLPTLEYWRNQTAVYDADRRITGIKEGINTPSRGSCALVAGTKSERQRKRRKHT